MKRILMLFIPLFALAACSFDDLGTPEGTERVGEVKNARDARIDSRGSLLGDDGILSIGGPAKEKDDGTGKSGISVNSFLWRATLDTLSFMPIASADPFGGVIITDWYEAPDAQGERFKVNAIILSKTLRADGIKISVFKQKMDKGDWRDQPVDNATARKLEDAVLTRARELRITSSK